MDWTEITQAIILATISILTPVVALNLSRWTAAKARQEGIVATDEDERQLRDDMAVAIKAVAERVARTVKAGQKKPAWHEQQAAAVEVARSMRPYNAKQSDFKLNSLAEAALGLVGEGATESGKAQPTR